MIAERTERSVEIIACPTCGRLEVDLFGIAAGKGVAILYRKGEVVRRIAKHEIVDAAYDEVMKM